MVSESLRDASTAFPRRVLWLAHLRSSIPHDELSQWVKALACQPAEAAQAAVAVVYNGLPAANDLQALDAAYLDAPSHMTLTFKTVFIPLSPTAVKGLIPRLRNSHRSFYQCPADLLNLRSGSLATRYR